MVSLSLSLHTHTHTHHREKKEPSSGGATVENVQQVSEDVGVTKLVPVEIDIK